MSERPTAADPYKPPEEVPQPRGLGPLTVLIIMALAVTAVIITFCVTCFPSALIAYDAGASGQAMDLISVVCGFIAVVVGLLAARSMIRDRQRLNVLQFEREQYLREEAAKAAKASRSARSDEAN